MQIHTRNLAVPLTITRAMGVLQFSIKAQGGTVGFTGNLTFNGVAPEQIVLAEGDTHLVSAPPSMFIEGITITPLSGIAVLEIFQ